MATITINFPGIEPRPPEKKRDLFWWFGNDEASAVGNTFYYKYIRNPLQNFRWYVIGFVDCPHTVTGRDSGDLDRPLVALRSDIRPVPESGWTWSYIHPNFPFVSYSSKRFTFYCGWLPHGEFGVKVNFSNSDLA
ncbi:MAG: hypothetical protein ACM3IH_03345 [Sphingobacteriales bacterium]